MLPYPMVDAALAYRFQLSSIPCQLALIVAPGELQKRGIETNYPDLPIPDRNRRTEIPERGSPFMNASRPSLASSHERATSASL